jgi:hypothetical protein
VRLLKWAIALALISPLAAKADTIDFHAVNPGSALWDGGNTALTASSSNVFSQIIPGGLSTPLAGSVLSFTTGAYSSGFGGIYTFGSGGSVSVSGCGSSCFLGNFTQGQLLFSAAGNTATFVGNFIAGQLDASFFGYATGASGSISASFANVNFPSSGGMTGDWASGDLTLTPTTASPVPEPSTIVLVAAGLLALVLLKER